MAMKKQYLLLLNMIFCGTAWAECPDGYTEYLGPASNMIRDANGNCSPLCESGVTSLNTANGYKFDLFSSKNTTPAINIGFGDTVCYADLISGQSAGTLNIQYDNKTFHANPDSGNLCPVTYSLTYDCGDGAFGTPPDTKDILYGNMYSAPYDAGTCIKPGYYLSGWKIDDTELTLGQYYSYTYDTDKTMVAQWTTNYYGAVYLCNYCTNGVYTTSESTGAKYGDEFTTKTSLECQNPLHQTLQGYRIYDVFGNDTGQTVAPEETVTYTYNTNIHLRALWDDGDIARVPRYNLSYDCGDGAIGTPPETKDILYGNMYSAPYDAGTCIKPGYYLSGWKIDDTELTLGQYYSYTYDTDKTMVAQWTTNYYGAVYLCNNGDTSSSYISGTFGNTYTPSDSICTAPDGTTFGGYDVLDVFGNETGDTIGVSETFTWTYPYNIQLRAIWTQN